MMNISPPLRFNEGTSYIWQALEAIPRTGWVKWGIPHPETVAQHILAIRTLALDYRAQIDLTEEDFLDLLAIIEVHDWPEVITGDIVVMGNEPNAKQLRDEKHAAELRAMEKICADIPGGAQALELYLRFETGQDKVSGYAKELDKLQAVILAAAYEEKYDKPGLTAEFINYSRPFITTPFLLAHFQDIANSVKTAAIN